MSDLMTLLRNEDPEVQWTGQGGLFRKAADQIEKLRYVLEEVRDLIDGYVDADHKGNGYVPNNAMRAQLLINEVLLP